MSNTISVPYQQQPIDYVYYFEDRSDVANAPNMTEPTRIKVTEHHPIESTVTEVVSYMQDPMLLKIFLL